MPKPSLLIVDDNRFFLTRLPELFSDDFNVLTASCAKEALAILYCSHNLSLIMIDLMMPRISGLELLRRIREDKNNSHIKIVVITGSKRSDWAIECANLNIQGYFQKPFNDYKLLEKVKTLTGTGNELSSSVLMEIWGDGYYKRINSVGITIKGALSYIENNFHKECGRTTIAAHLDVSQDYLSRAFKKECGIGLIEYIKLLRIKQSQERLSRNPHVRLKKLASSVGIPNVDYFCKIFKKETGFTLTEFREKTFEFNLKLPPLQKNV